MIGTDDILDRLFTVFAKLLITAVLLLLILGKGLTAWFRYSLYILIAIGIIGVLATVMIEDYKENRGKGSK